MGRPAERRASSSPVLGGPRPRLHQSFRRSAQPGPAQPATQSLRPEVKVTAVLENYMYLVIKEHTWEVIPVPKRLLEIVGQEMQGGAWPGHLSSQSHCSYKCELSWCFSGFLGTPAPHKK